ncbi:MAG: GTPase [Nostoc sp. DedSLP03]|uniref:GTPase n=1 Tax=Nostoc sp. DedSLP03 TaxID=3075400 RepID=UPI002AD25DD1|nr:GTPase [Nostoc sp. DedSLP03]MDZ7969732.1 GTPase [Nostoc sp. DedSLP03]
MIQDNQPTSEELKQLIAKVQYLFNEARKRNLTFLLVGRTGVGKSSTINTLMGQKLAEVGKFRPVTKSIEEYKSKIEGIPYTVVDTPGLADTSENEQEYINSIKSAIPEPDSIWFVTILGENRVRDDERKTINTISSAFGKQAWEKAVIVFTYADKVDADEYNEYFLERTKLIQEEIAISIKNTDIAQQIPSVAVANNPRGRKPLPTPDDKPWLNELYTTVIKRISDRALPSIVLATASRVIPQDTNSQEVSSSSEAEPIFLNKKQQQEIQEKLEKSNDFAGITAFVTAGAIVGFRGGSVFGLPGIVVGGAIGAATSLFISWWRRR